MFLNRSVIGLDLSLNSTGYCFIANDTLYSGTIQSKAKGVERLLFIETKIASYLSSIVLADRRKVLFVIEGYSMGHKGGGRAFDIGELGGVIRLLAWKKGHDLLIVPPTTLKLFVAGNGSASKEEMMDAVSRNWGFKTESDDEADAFGLMKLGIAFAENGRKARNPKRKQALSKVQYFSNCN